MTPHTHRALTVGLRCITAVFVIRMSMTIAPTLDSDLRWFQVRQYFSMVLSLLALFGMYRIASVMVGRSRALWMTAVWVTVALNLIWVTTALAEFRLEPPLDTLYMAAIMIGIGTRVVAFGVLARQLGSTLWMVGWLALGLLDLGIHQAWAWSADEPDTIERWIMARHISTALEGLALWVLLDRLLVEGPGSALTGVWRPFADACGRLRVWLMASVGVYVAVFVLLMHRMYLDTVAIGLVVHGVISIALLFGLRSVVDETARAQVGFGLLCVALSVVFSISAAPLRMGPAALLIGALLSILGALMFNEANGRVGRVLAIEGVVVRTRIIRLIIIASSLGTVLFTKGPSWTGYVVLMLPAIALLGLGLQLGVLRLLSRVDDGMVVPEHGLDEVFE